MGRQLLQTSSIEQVPIYDFAPGRALFIVSASALSAVLAGIVAASGVKAEGASPAAPMTAGTIGAMLGFGASLAISIPLTSSLGARIAPGDAGRHEGKK